MAEPAARSVLPARLLRRHPGKNQGRGGNKAVYIARAVLPDGTKEVLGLWIEQTEAAKFWLRVMNELKNRGCQGILIAVVDGLKVFPEALTAAFPQTLVQTCIVHLIRHSLEFVSLKDRKPVVPALRAIAPKTPSWNEGTAGVRSRIEYPAITQSWRRNWEHVIPFFAFPEGVRRIIYTTDASRR